MDSAPPQSGDLLLSLSAAAASAPEIEQNSPPGAEPSRFLHELWRKSEAASCSLTAEEFSHALTALGTRLNHGCAPFVRPDTGQQAAFYSSLHLSEFALAQACALGREAAWERFLALYRPQLTQAATSITGSATLGHELADSLYAELYGLREQDGHRRCPLASYSGRGSLLGWLRTTLAQRHVDHHRRTYRETPLDDLSPPASPAPGTPTAVPISRLVEAVAATLRSLAPEERFLLSAYYLDRQTLLQIGRTLAVHEATVSRRLKHLTDELRKQLLHHLQRGGLDKRAAQEALGTDPRDVEINLRSLLQTSQSSPFPVQTASQSVVSTTNLAETPTAAQDPR